jgi:hypothetical protein
LPLLPSLARRWLVAAVAAAGDGQNILPMLGEIIIIKIDLFIIAKNITEFNTIIIQYFEIY